MKQIGTMRCPVGAIVSMATGKPEILDEAVRCWGEGPVFEFAGTSEHTLFIHCNRCCEKPEPPIRPELPALDPEWKDEQRKAVLEKSAADQQRFDSLKKEWDLIVPPQFIQMNAAIWRGFVPEG